MTIEGTPLADETAVADSTLPASTSRREPTHRTKAMLSILGVLALVAVVLLSVLVHSRRSRAIAVFEPVQMSRPNCQPNNDFTSSDDNDPFDFSVVEYSVGYYYSYQHRNTNETKGPKVLVMLAILPAGYYRYTSTARKKTAYSFYATVQPGNLMYSLEMTIGKYASDGRTVWSGWDDTRDGNVTIDPSVVRVRFNNKLTYNVYNDTVFLVSYAGANNTLRVELRKIDLSNVTLLECGVKQLLDENVELSTFYSLYILRK
jgi:hypothetical protein